MSKQTPPVRVSPVAHLPIIRGALDQLGILEVLDRYLPKHTLAKVSDAECFTTMVASILSGRQALWRLDQWLERVDLELLVGEGSEAAAFHDTRLGVALDVNAHPKPPESSPGPPRDRTGRAELPHPALPEH